MLANNHRASPGDSGEAMLPPLSPEPLRPLTAREVELVDRAVSVLLGVSRTFAGISDTTSSAEKPKLLLEGPALAEKVVENFRVALGGLLAAAPLDLGSRADVLVLLRSIALACNAGLVPEDRPLFRSWQTGVSAHPAPEDIEARLNAFADELLERYPRRKEDPIGMAAWIEQELNGRIHPFSDGCGRVSRVLASFVLAESDLPLPRYSNRSEFFRMINRPYPEWAEYYRAIGSGDAG